MYVKQFDNENNQNLVHRLVFFQCIKVYFRKDRVLRKYDLFPLKLKNTITAIVSLDVLYELANLDRLGNARHPVDSNTELALLVRCLNEWINQLLEIAPTKLDQVLINIPLICIIIGTYLIMKII